MVTLAKLIGVFIGVVGVIFILNPKSLKQFVAFMKQGKRIYAAGVLRLLFGIILLQAASRCQSVMIITLLGILFIIAGVLIFAFPLQKIKTRLDALSAKPLLTLRLVSFIPLIIGLLILYSV